MNYALLIDTPSCARHLGQLGAQARKDREREARRAFHRDLREQLGLPEEEALR